MRSCPQQQEAVLEDIEYLVGRFLRPLTIRLNDAWRRLRQATALDSNHQSPPWLTEDAIPRSLQPVVRRILYAMTALSTKFLPDDQLQTRPYFSDCADLYVNETERQG